MMFRDPLTKLTLTKTTCYYICKFPNTVINTHTIYYGVTNLINRHTQGVFKVRLGFLQ